MSLSLLAHTTPWSLSLKNTLLTVPTSYPDGQEMFSIAVSDCSRGLLQTRNAIPSQSHLRFFDMFCDTDVTALSNRLTGRETVDKTH